jgi:tetratricopeptide (TPR) repeat protein
VHAFALAVLLAQALRPSECAALEGPRTIVVWQRVKSPELARYCDRIAFGVTKLATEPGMPQAALETGVEAEKLLPGRAPAMVLAGRAYLRLDRAGEAYAALREAKKRSERALDEPHALLAWARAAARTGHTDEARDAYLALLPSADGLPLAERSSAYVEAGMLLLVKGPERIAEAVTTLRQARRDAYGDLQLVAVAALALALDRAGEHAEARAALTERPYPGLDDAIERARQRRVLGPEPNEPEALALKAMVAEVLKPKSAREAWRKYLDAVPTGSWTAHAKEREGGAGRPGARK